jgi:23S rRNA (cytosine1962-C5)-methyltransferase
MIQISNNWKDFELIDAGDGEKLERWGSYILRRPDPQAIWARNVNLEDSWENPDMFYHRSRTGGGFWEVRKDELREVKNQTWEIKYNDLKFKIKPTGFKHTGLFPEQAVNWDWIIERIKNFPQPKVLNLFAYTGGATVASAFAGADVVHIDAAYGMNAIAKENLELSGLANANVRILQDDVVKFVEREVRRENKYDLIIMDPPAYGRGSGGDMWEIESGLTALVESCVDLLSETAFGFIVNTYATEISTYSIENIFKSLVADKLGGNTEAFELGLPISTMRGSQKLVLPTGMVTRWFR